MNTYKERSYTPTLEDFKTMAGRGNLIPLYTEILADMDTPVSAFQKIKKDEYSFLLESMQGGEKWARYSFIGVDPALIFKCKGKKVTLIKKDGSEEVSESEYPLDVLRQIQNTLHHHTPPLLYKQHK